jgi:ribosomal protein S18 acetylase RimI-like enzyme
LNDSAALEIIGKDDVTALTKRATNSTFYAAALSPEQLDELDRVVRISAQTALDACGSECQLFSAAFVGGSFAGYMIATLHAPDDRELDWMMVDPDFHGNGVANALMRTGMEWLGTDRPMWLNVIQHNERAIRFYRKHGFEVDPDARTNHAVPHFIMRRPADRQAA